MFQPRLLRACFVTLQRSLSLDPVVVLKDSGVRWEEIDSLLPINAGTMASLIELLAARAPLGAGAECGLQARMRNLGLVGCMLLNCSTLRESLEHWVQYWQLASHPMAGEVRIDAHRWEFRQRPPFAVARQSG